MVTFSWYLRGILDQRTWSHLRILENSVIIAHGIYYCLITLTIMSNQSLHIISAQIKFAWTFIPITGPITPKKRAKNIVFTSLLWIPHFIAYLFLHASFFLFLHTSLFSYFCIPSFCMWRKQDKNVGRTIKRKKHEQPTAGDILISIWHRQSEYMFVDYKKYWFYCYLIVKNWIRTWNIEIIAQSSIRQWWIDIDSFLRLIHICRMWCFGMTIS